MGLFALTFVKEFFEMLPSVWHNYAEEKDRPLVSFHFASVGLGWGGIAGLEAENAAGRI